MELSYKSNKLEKQLTKPREIAKSFGAMARKVEQRMSELKALSTLAEYRHFPAARCHELSGNRRGQLAVDVSKSSRLIFEPDHNPIPKKESGGLDWLEVNAIRILEIDNYHSK